MKKKIFGKSGTANTHKKNCKISKSIEHKCFMFNQS